MKGIKNMLNLNLLKKFIAPLMVIILFTAGCTSTSPTPEPQPTPGSEPQDKIEDYLPLSEGNKWVYEGIGCEYASYTEEVTHVKDNRYQVIINNGGTSTANRYIITVDSIVQDYMEHEFYEDKSILDSPANHDEIIMKLPLEVGNSWISGDNIHEVYSVNSTIQVPAGTFSDCLVIRISYKDSGNYTYQYYKKDVGLVKSEYVMDNNEKVESLLKEYIIR